MAARSLNKMRDDVYAKQPAGAYASKEEYVSELKRLANRLFGQKPADLDITEGAYEALLLSIQKEHALPLREIERRLRDFPKVNADFDCRP